MTMMAEIEDFLPGVMSRAPSVPIPEAVAAVRDAARTVCRRLKLWRCDDELIVAAPEYEALYTQPDAQIMSIDYAAIEGTSLVFHEPEWLDREFPGWRKSEPGTARYITQNTPGQITLFPRQNGVLSLSVVLIPALDAETLPDFLLKGYADLIATGAAGAIIANVPNPEFYNPALGTALIAKFGSDLDALNAKAARPQIHAPMRARARFF